MIMLSKLKPHTMYRCSSTAISYYDNAAKRKNSMVSVWAPSYADELEFFKSSHFLFREISRYYQEKITAYKYYGKAMQRITNNNEVFTKENIEKIKAKNLSQLNYYHYPLPASKTDVLKGFNFIYEANHVLNEVMDNDKDRRAAVHKPEELLRFFKTYYVDKIDTRLAYPIRTIYIPIHMWLSEDMYKDSKTFTKTNRNFISYLYNLFINKEEEFKKIFKGYRIVLANYNEVMILDPSVEEIPNSYAELLRSFLRKCRSNKNYPSTEETDTTEELKSVEVASIEEDRAEEIIEKLNINTEDIPAEKIEQLKTIVSEELVKDDDMASDISIKDIKTIKSSDELDDILNAKLEGTTISNYRRNEMLKTKYKELKINDKKIEDIISEKQAYDVEKFETKTNTINEDYNEITTKNFEKAYNEQLADRDLMKILLHFMKTNPGFFLINDPIVEDVSNMINRVLKYTVEFESTDRKRHKFSFLMPKFHQDRYLFLNGSKWDITHQKFPYPVTKIKTDQAQACSNYNKIFIERYGSNVSPRMTKLLKALLGDNLPGHIKVVRGNMSEYNKDIMTTIEYGEMCKEVSKLTVGNTVMYFNHQEALAVIPEHKNRDYIPLGTNSNAKAKYYLNSLDNKIFDTDNKEHGELSEFITNLIGERDPKFKEAMDKYTVGTKFVYSRATILGQQVPLILVLAAGNVGGYLLDVLEKAKIPYEISEKRVNVDKSQKGVIQFSDCYLIFDRYPYENSLLLNGLGVVNTKEYTFAEMGQRDTYVDIFDTLYNSRTMIDGIENFHHLFLDPITEEVCEKLNLPNSYEGLLIYSNGVLADNDYMIDTSYEQCRIRSNEIVNVYLYQCLCDAFKNYRMGRNPKFSFPEDAVIKAMMTSPVIDGHTQLNVTKNVENDRQIKMKGPVGMNVDDAYTLDKRAFSDSMAGLIALSSTPSGEVGVKRHMTLNSNIADARGFLNVNKKEYNATEMLSPGELMNTFAIESADAERVAMAITQSKHVIPVVDNTTSPITFDMERIAPKLATDFSVTAEEDGQVIDIIENIMFVKYKSGKVIDIDLSEKPDKNGDGGFYIMNKLETRYKKDSRFKAGDIIAYNPKQISEPDIYGDYCATNGTLARIAIRSTGSEYEDSTMVTQALADRLTAYVTVQKDIVISKHSNIRFIAKKGSTIEANDPLILFDDTQDEFTSQLLATMAEEVEDSDQIIATTAPILSKVSGRIADIQIHYTVPIEEMTPSLQKIIKEYSSDIAKREKALKKYIDPKNSNTILTSSGQTTPDRDGRVKGVYVGEGVKIEFFMEYKDVYGVGDKLTHYGALKGINGDIVPLGLEGFAESNPERKIDAYLSQIGVYKRMTLDVLKLGIATKTLIERKRQLRDKYLDKLEKEVKG